MLWPDVPAQAICRLRSIRTEEPVAADPDACNARRMLNVLGALHIQDQDLQLYRGTSAEPNAVRIARIAEAECRLYLAVDSLPGSANGPFEQESGNLVAWLGNVWVLIPCQLTQGDAAANPARVTALLPREAFYVRVRSRPRVSLAGRRAVWLEYPAAGTQDAMRYPVVDVSEQGIGFTLREGSADLPTFMENVVLRDSTGPVATLDIECVRRPAAPENSHAGARVRWIDAVRGDRLHSLLTGAD